MVYEKYVVELGWHIKLFPACTAALPQLGAPQDKGTAAGLVMLHSLTAWLQVSFITSFCMMSVLCQSVCICRDPVATVQD